MFRGLNAVSLDSKGRFAVPARTRTVLLALTGSHALDEGVVVEGGVPVCSLVATIDPHAPCILLYPLSEWEKVEAQLQALPTLHKATRRMQRLLIGHATVHALDGQGRILLAAFLREYAGLEKKTVLVGQGKRMELWSESRWHQERARWLEESSREDADTVPDALNVLCL